MFIKVIELKDLVQRSMGLIADSHFKSGKGDPKGIPSGYEDLDRITGGFKKGKVTAIVGRPAMGKTLLALNIARNIVFKGVPVLVFSLDWPKEDWMRIFLCSQAKADLHKVRIGFFNEEDNKKLVEAAKNLPSLPLFIVDHARKVEDIEKTIEEVVKEKRVDIVLIDGIRNIQDVPLLTDKKRAKKYSQYGRVFKELALKYNIPFIYTQTLSRRFESNPRAFVSKYEYGPKEGNLVENVDRILHIYREEYYDPDESNRGQMDIRIPKMDYGEVDYTVRVNFSMEFGLIKDYESMPFNPDA